jgi:hypothetical protein
VMPYTLAYSCADQSSGRGVGGMPQCMCSTAESHTSS